MSAFDTKGPSTVLKGVRTKSAKQMKKDAVRKNAEASLCAFIPPEREQKLKKASI